MTIAKGDFDVKMILQSDDEAPAGRMTLDKEYKGDLSGLGAGQMISKQIENGAAAYFAVEEFRGSIAGKRGSFTLLHNGFMNKDSQSLNIIIMEGSGKGELANISGSMNIIQENGGHSYELDYELKS